jgi:Lon protease-like protein
MKRALPEVAAMTSRLRLFPLNAVLFPGSVLNLHVFEERYKRMISECVAGGEGFGVALIAEGAEAGDVDVIPRHVGCVAEIVGVTALAQGRSYVTAVGRDRFRIDEIVARRPFLIGEVRSIGDELGDGIQAVDDECSRVRVLFEEYVRMADDLPDTGLVAAVPDDATEASFFIADALSATAHVKQRLLELPTTKERLLAERHLLQTALPELRSTRDRRPPEPAGDAFRRDQERYFGKYFSRS